MHSLAFTQAQFATALGVGQGNVSKWVKGVNRPSPDVFARMAKLAPDADKFFFLEAAGVPKEFFLGGIEKRFPAQVVEAVDAIVTEAFYGQQPLDKVSAVMVPVLVEFPKEGIAAAGKEREVHSVIALPPSWLPKGGTLYAVVIRSHGMEPRLSQGDIAIVNAARNDPHELDGAMVAVEIEGAIEIGYWHKNGRVWQLVPEKLSPSKRIPILAEGERWSLFGEVVKCIAEARREPPSTTRRGRT